MTAWFERLFGFAEGAYEETQARFRLEGETLVVVGDGARRFGAGTFTTPSLAALRAAAHGTRPGRLRVQHVAVHDILETHADPANAGALFQVASQLNCLEFASPEVTPEHGVSGYALDPTQGPACALACAAATIARHYLVEVHGQRGQTRDRQIDTLADLLAALGPAGANVRVRNGYALATSDALEAVGRAVEAHEREALTGALRIGLHTGAEVTFARRFERPAAAQRVSQAFCSAMPCGYSNAPLERWQPLARCVLDAAYEATLLAAVLDAEHGRGSGRVWLTFLGGGAFGNDPRWIEDAMGRALARCAHHALDVHVAHHRAVDGARVRGVEAATHRHTRPA